MTMAANSSTGETRTCPHCKSTILKSSIACPACHHFLRFEAIKSGKPAPLVFQPLCVKGTIRQPASEGRYEYSVFVAVYDDRGEEISRHVVAVGALGLAEARTFKVWVEIYGAEGIALERPSF